MSSEEHALQPLRDALLSPGACYRGGGEPGFLTQHPGSGDERKGVGVSTQREGMGKEEGGGFRMGNTCIPVLGKSTLTFDCTGGIPTCLSMFPGIA